VQDWVITSGQLGTVTGDDGLPHLVEGGTVAELRQALANLSDVLVEEGATQSDVVKATIFVTDIDDYLAVNAVWREFYTDLPPCRSLVAVSALPLGARVEVEAWAHIGKHWGISSAPTATPI
jgi:2-iminobutanoate/2-iminopropanoate deaminase